MTSPDREYLARRGWLRYFATNADMAAGKSDDWQHGSDVVSTTDALTIQRARDDEKEAAAWVQFMAAAMIGEPTISCDAASGKTEAAMYFYRARFGEHAKGEGT